MAVEPIDLAAARIDRDEDYSLMSRPSSQQSKRSLADAMVEALREFTDAEIDAPDAPHPHLFFDDATNSGLAPFEEVSAWAGPPKNGKTTILTHVLGVQLPLGRDLGSYRCIGARGVVFVSIEDSKGQYLDKLKPEWRRLRPAERALVRRRVRVLDLREPEFRNVRALVQVEHGQPVPNHLAIETLVEAVRRATEKLDVPLGALVIETANRASDAAEDNPGWRMLIDVLQDLGRELGVAVIVTHHTNQAAEGTLRTMEISTADVRGGSSLIGNTREISLVIGLGSDKVPHKENDARTLLRRMVNPGNGERVTALICLGASKAEDPRPLFFRWEGTRQVQVELPTRLSTLSWWQLHAEIGKAKAEERAAQEDAEADAEVRKVAAIVRRLDAEGTHPTASAVSKELGKSSPTWSTPRLHRAVDLGLIVKRKEAGVPRTKAGILTDVYRPVPE